MAENLKQSKDSVLVIIKWFYFLSKPILVLLFPGTVPEQEHKYKSKRRKEKELEYSSCSSDSDSSCSSDRS